MFIGVYDKMVSKEEYVKNHMKMSLGIKIVIVLSIISFIMGIFLIVDFYLPVVDWINMILEYDEDAGKYLFELLVFVLLCEFLHYARVFMLAKKMELGEYYESYCEYKKRSDNLNKSKETDEEVSVEDISKR